MDHASSTRGRPGFNSEITTRSGSRPADVLFLLIGFCRSGRLVTIKQKAAPFGRYGFHRWRTLRLSA